MNVHVASAECAEISVQDRSGVRTIRIDRVDKKNALNQPMYAAMAGAIAGANADEAIRAVAVLGRPGIFTAGNDLKDFMSFANGGELAREVNVFLSALVTNAKPLVAGVDGPAVGVGTTMLLHCDYVVLSERASLSTPFINLGLLPEAGSSLLGPRLMGHARAFEMLVMGRPFDAAKAVTAGIANEVVSSDELEARTLAVAAEIAAKPAEAVAIARRLLKGDTEALAARVAEETALFGARLKSDEARAAFATFFGRKS